VVDGDPAGRHRPPDNLAEAALMNDRTAVTIYGIVGQPAGTVIGDDLFDADGNQVAFIEGGLLFSADDGEWFGSYV
jgi:hypothetical protein